MTKYSHNTYTNIIPKETARQLLRKKEKYLDVIHTMLDDSIKTYDICIRTFDLAGIYEESILIHQTEEVSSTGQHPLTVERNVTIDISFKRMEASYRYAEKDDDGSETNVHQGIYFKDFELPSLAKLQKLLEVTFYN